MPSLTLNGPDYALAIHDNEPSDDPKVGAGHNGIRRWQPEGDPDVRLVAHSWLNLEHVVTEDRKFSGNREDPGFFEPRQFPARLESNRAGNSALTSSFCHYLYS